VASLAWSAREGRQTRGLGAGGDPLEEQEQDNPSRLVGVELFLSRAERERGERKRDARIAVHTQNERERGGERGDAHATLATRRRETKKGRKGRRSADGRTSAVFTSQRIIPRRVRPRRIAIVREISPRVTRPSARANLRKIRSIDCSIVRERVVFIFFSSLPSLRVSRDVRASISFCLSPSPLCPCAPPFALADALVFSLSVCLSLSPPVVQCAEYNAVLHYRRGQKCASPECWSTAARSSRSSLSRARGNRRGAYPEGPPGGTTECLSGSADPRAAGGGGVGGEGGRGSGGGRCQERRGARKGPCRTQHRRRSSSTDKYVVPQRRQATHGHGRYQTVSLESCIMKTAPSPPSGIPLLLCFDKYLVRFYTLSRSGGARESESRSRRASLHARVPQCARARVCVCVSYKVLRADRPRSRIFRLSG